MKFLKSLALGLSCSAVFLRSAQAVEVPPILIFEDRPAWEAAVGEPYLEETFSRTYPYWFNFTPSIRLWSSTTEGVLRSTVNKGSQGDVINFDGFIRAFGGSWDLRPGLAGTGLQIKLIIQPYTSKDPNDYVIYTLKKEIDRNYSGGFFGFVSPYALTTNIIIEGGNQGGSSNWIETYELDNVAFVASNSFLPPQPIPEPSTNALITIGITIIGFFAFRRSARFSYTYTVNHRNLLTIKPQLAKGDSPTSPGETAWA